jgi:hypothetical protein
MADVLRRRNWRVVELAPITAEERRALAQSYLKSYGKEMTGQRLGEFGCMLGLGKRERERERERDREKERERERERQRGASLHYFSPSFCAPDQIVSAKQTENPLFLKLLIDELRVVGRFDRLEQQINVH